MKTPKTKYFIETEKNVTNLEASLNAFRTNEDFAPGFDVLEELQAAIFVASQAPNMKGSPTLLEAETYKRSVEDRKKEIEADVHDMLKTHQELLQSTKAVITSDTPSCAFHALHFSSL